MTISTSDDSNAEDIEELVLSVRFGGSSPARLVGDQEVVVTIVDNDERMFILIMYVTVYVPGEKSVYYIGKFVVQFIMTFTIVDNIRV